jgi:hypothetical protein
MSETALRLQLDTTRNGHRPAFRSPWRAMFSIWLLVGAIATMPPAHAGAHDAAGPDENDAGLQTVAVERYGVTVKVPEGWELVVRGRDDRAFVLLLPQDDGVRPGVAACEIAIAPESLENYQSRIARNAEGLPPERKLVHNRILPAEQSNVPREAKPKMLDSLWKFTPPDGTTWYELKIRRIENAQLYTFVLVADQDHFEAFRHEFFEAIGKAKFAQPDTGLQALPGGYWMHRELHFGLKLPEGWKPSFPLSERAPF